MFTLVLASYNQDCLFCVDEKLNRLMCNVFFFQDMPVGLMDDIYDFISKFAERIDDLEEVLYNTNPLVVLCLKFVK